MFVVNKNVSYVMLVHLVIHPVYNNVIFVPLEVIHQHQGKLIVHYVYQEHIPMVTDKQSVNNASQVIIAIHMEIQDVNHVQLEQFNL